MKTIGIDFLPVENSPAGIGQYTLSLFSCLFELAPDEAFVIYSTKTLPKKFPPNVKNIVIDWPKYLPFKGIRWFMKVASDVKIQKIDLFFSISNFLFPLLIPNTIQFIHDIAPIKFPKFFSPMTRLSFPIMAGMAMNKAIKIITISNQVKKELLEYRPNIPGEKIAVIYPGINQNILINPKKFTGFDLNCDYILSIATFEPRKNYPASFKLFANLIKAPEYAHYKYLIVGKKGWYYDKIFENVKALGLTEKVVFLGYVEDQYIADIIKRCKCMLFLSYYEGFGMPPIEALYFNKPVVVNDIPVFREIYGNLAKYIDCTKLDENIEMYTAKIIDTININNVDYRIQIMQKFNNETSARKFLNLIQQL